VFLWELRPASIANRRMLPLFVYPSDLRVHVNACAQSASVAAYVHISEKIIFRLELRHTRIQHLSSWAIKLTVIQTSGISVIG
jgi:hypothetical protein